MITELGHFALILAFAIAVVNTVVPMIGAAKGWDRWMAMAGPAATLQLVLVGFSFVALTIAFVGSDFSLRLVVLNSHTLKPMLYKIAGVWANHEGSLLLWVLILSVFGACAAWFGGGLPATLKARVLAVQSSIAVAFLAFILLTSNPFLRLAAPPFNGEDLNPLLQDPGLAFHPPFLYLGYVGLSLTFSFAVAALIEGRVDAAWGRWVRPWTLAAWIFLTIGIGMGSWWAYYELGWGGFWFWDPVENASFMPWLLAAALLHSAVVVEKRESLKSWTILLAIMAFGFSLIGTFIVRSGVITSVHAFASDPERGLFILGIIGVFMGGALTLYALRASAMEAKGAFSMVSRESALVLNNILLAVVCFVVFVGTIWPLVAELTFGRKLSVGAPFFNLAATPFFLALGVVLPIGAMLPWKRGNLGKVVRRMTPVAILAVAVAALVWAMQNDKTALAPIGVMLGVWLMLGALIDLAMRTGRGTVGQRLVRLTRIPRADLGKAVAHGGFGVTVFAISALLAWQIEDIRAVKPGESFDLGGYRIQLNAVNDVRGPNYTSNMGEVDIFNGDVKIATVEPERRFYPFAGMPTTESGILSGPIRDIYVVIGDPQPDGSWAMRSYIKPFANWIWGGAILMAIGGMLSLSDRRYRVAAGARKITSKAVPAE